MCDKNKYLGKDTNEFHKEWETECGKSCQKPSLCKRVLNSGMFIRWWELAIFGAIIYLFAEHKAYAVANAPAIVAPLLLLWFINFLKRIR